MSDLTIYAENLISTVARAFYEDDVVCLIDVLIRDKFLRDDDMSPRLNLPAKRLRATLQFLHEEHLVRAETVDDLAQGGSQATKFYYLDYNRAVHSIRLRIYLWKKRLERDELHARSQSFYLCPGYESRRCNGRYSEEDAQHCIDRNTCLFLCQECHAMYENDPNQPDASTYTLKLVDNTKELRMAMDRLRRVNVQLSSKFIGNQQLRPGIYDLLQKVRPASGKAAKPITSNLPSENFALGIGSKRLAGTGRTAGIKEKKLLQQGVAQSAAQARSYLVAGGGGGGDSDDDDDDDNNPNSNSGSNKSSSSALTLEQNWLFLKNAMGHEIQFTVERGGAARAQLLVSSNNTPRLRRRHLRKLLDAAASRVGSSLPIPVRVRNEQERIAKRKLAAMSRMAGGKASNTHATKSKLIQVGDSFEFLKDNIGRANLEDKEMALELQRQQRLMKSMAGDDTDHTDHTDHLAENHDQQHQQQTLSESFGDNNNGKSWIVLADDGEEMQKLSDERRLSTFQTAYNIEMERQEKLLSMKLQKQQQLLQQRQQMQRTSNGACAFSKKFDLDIIIDVDYENNDSLNADGNGDDDVFIALSSPPPSLCIPWDDGEVDLRLLGEDGEDEGWYPSTKMLKRTHATTNNNNNNDSSVITSNLNQTPNTCTSMDVMVTN